MQGFPLKQIEAGFVRLGRHFQFAKNAETEPEKAYDTWAEAYDDQPGNLMLHLDSKLFDELLSGLDLKGKQLYDVGCGTGRHWPMLMDKNIAGITGFDISVKMLEKLREKFPGSKTVKTGHWQLPALPASCDVLVSTLALAHIREAGKALCEWVRVLKPGGEILVTDFHPASLAKGAKRNFQHRGKWIAVENHIQPVKKTIRLLEEAGCSLLAFYEKKIDASVRNWYENKQALDVYEKFYGVPVIYGLHLRKKC